MRPIAFTLSLTLGLLGAAWPASASDERVFTGVLDYVDGEGELSFCPLQQADANREIHVFGTTVQLYPGHPTCTAPLRPDGTFAGQCSVGFVDTFSGTITGNTLILQSAHRNTKAMCRYKAVLNLVAR
jgi:hypothetical protein